MFAENSVQMIGRVYGNHDERIANQAHDPPDF